jgi:hypothetical protein
MRTLSLNINLFSAGRRKGLLNPFRLPLLTQIGESTMKIIKAALVIVMGILFLFGFYMGFTLLALKILL